jgi:hypothetical protein
MLNLLSGSESCICICNRSAGFRLAVKGSYPRMSLRNSQPLRLSCDRVIVASTRMLLFTYNRSLQAVELLFIISHCGPSGYKPLTVGLCIGAHSGTSKEGSDDRVESTEDDARSDCDKQASQSMRVRKSVHKLDINRK